MQVDISTQNLFVDNATEEHVERQMDFALGQFETWITHVQVHLEDINKEKHGVDKQCRVLVGLKGGKTIKIEDIDTDIIVAVNRAADRVSHTVAREVDRRREKKAVKSAAEE